MTEHVELLDLTDELMERLRVFEMTAEAVDDEFDRDALLAGAAVGMNTLRDIKALLQNKPSDMTEQ